MGLITFHSARSQELISPEGNSAVLGQYLMEWSIGEIVTAEANTSGNKFTQGMHQPKYKVSGISTGNEGVSARIYPNPFKDQLHIELEGNHHARLINPLGQVVREFNFEQSKQLDLETLNASFYFLQIQSENQGVFQEIKLIKSH